VNIVAAPFFLKNHENGSFFAAGSAGMNTRWNDSRISWMMNLKACWPMSGVIGFDWEKTGNNISYLLINRGVGLLRMTTTADPYECHGAVG
jgi:hypothetical protein